MQRVSELNKTALVRARQARRSRPAVVASESVEDSRAKLELSKPGPSSHDPVLPWSILHQSPHLDNQMTIINLLTARRI